MARIWIAGSGGAALEAWAVYSALVACGRPIPELAGFITLEPPAFPTGDLSLRWEGEFLENGDIEKDLVVVAIGSSPARDRIASRFEEHGFHFATLVHPAAVLGPRVTIGEGGVVMACAVLETDVILGAHALVNVQSSLAHECRAGRACSLGPGVHIAGGVCMGDRCDLGVGAVVRPGVRLGNDVVVGAGAAVVRNWDGPVVLGGVPARKL